MTEVSMEQVQKIIAGSRARSKMQEEIGIVLDSLLGRQMFTKEEISRFKFGDSVCEFTTEGLRWKVFKSKKSLNVYIFDINRAGDRFEIPIYGWSWVDLEHMLPPVQYVELIHKGLPDLLSHFLEVFPTLKERWTVS